MANRDTPYGAFNFVVNFDGGDTFGGFSDVSGIGTEITVAEYRNGNEKENHVRKVPGRAQGQRRHAQARHRRLEVAVRLDQGHAHQGPGRQEEERDHHAARRGAGQGAELGARAT